MRSRHRVPIDEDPHYGWYLGRVAEGYATPGHIFELQRTRVGVTHIHLPPESSQPVSRGRISQVLKKLEGEGWLMREAIGRHRKYSLNHVRLVEYTLDLAKQRIPPQATWNELQRQVDVSSIKNPSADLLSELHSKLFRATMKALLAGSTSREATTPDGLDARTIQGRVEMLLSIGYRWIKPHASRLPQTHALLDALAMLRYSETMSPFQLAIHLDAAEGELQGLLRLELPNGAQTLACNHDLWAFSIAKMRSIDAFTDAVRDGGLKAMKTRSADDMARVMQDFHGKF